MAMSAMDNRDEFRPDVQGLLNLAGDKSVAGRTTLVGAVSDLYFSDQANQEGFGERETALMSEILQQLIRDVEMPVRRALAERLAAQSGAPADLVITLANDEIEVARPILMKSLVLADDDLIAVVRRRTLRHQLAIAVREQLREGVSDALVETGDDGVIQALLKNDNAEISLKTFDYLVAQSRSRDGLREPLLRREDLALDLAKKMYWWVSAALRQHIVENFDVDVADLDQTIEATALSVIETARKEALTGGHATKDLVDHLWKTNALTPRVLIQVLREGEVPLFEAMLGRAMGLGRELTQQILYDSSGTGLTVACKSVCMDKGDFASLFLLSRQGRPGDKSVEPDELSRVLAMFDTLDSEAAKNIVKRWRRDPNYQAALDSL